MKPNHDITMNQTGSPVISRRQKTAGPLHHLWNNHGTWWFHCTFHLPDGLIKKNKSLGQCKLRSRNDFPLNLGAFVGEYLAQIILGLKTDQKTGRDSEVALETQGGIS